MTFKPQNPTLAVKLIEVNLLAVFDYISALYREMPNAPIYADLETAMLALQHWRQMSAEGKQNAADDLCDSVPVALWVGKLAEHPRARMAQLKKGK